LRDGAVGDGAPLRVIALEQTAAGDAADDGIELPRDVVGVLNAGVAAEPSGWWHDMRAVADEEHPAAAEAVGNQCRRRPRPCVDDGDLQVRPSGAAADQIAAAIRREILRTFTAVRDVLNRHQPAAVAARHEGAVDVGDEHRSHEAAVDCRRQVSLEDHVHPVLEDAGSVAYDPQRLAHRTVGSIRADQVLRAYRLLVSVGSIANEGRDAIIILIERHELGVESDIGAEPRGAGSQDRLELILIAGRRRRRTEVAGVGPGHALPRDCVVRQVRHPADERGAIVDQVPRANLGFDAEAPVDLHRSRRDASELVLNGRPWMAFHDRAGHAAMREEERERQPVEAAADDQNWCGVLHNRPSLFELL